MERDDVDHPARVRLSGFGRGIEVLSTDPARDLVYKLGAYAAAGLPRSWVAVPSGPEIVTFERTDGVLAEAGRHGPGAAVSLDIGPATLALDPADLLLR